MKFTAHVTMVEPAVQIEKASEMQEAKDMLLKALQILSKSDMNIVQEAKEYLKGANV